VPRSAVVRDQLLSAWFRHAGSLGGPEAARSRCRRPEGRPGRRR
jgi:hypothetical protein